MPPLREPRRRQVRERHHGARSLRRPADPGSLAYLSARSHAEYDGGDHGIFLGEVTDVQIGSGEPLIFYRGMYGLPDSIRVSGLG